jgi:L-cystine uptake protein TcyP (sodium:dicarboxylate symporter family)
MEFGLNSVLFSSFIINFFIAASMKKILKSIRVMQIISFLGFIEVSYSAVAILFNKHIYNFATFNIVPKDLQ